MTEAPHPLTVIRSEAIDAPAAYNPPNRIQPAEWDMLKEMASSLEAAGRGTSILPKGITTRYQVAAILMKGAELGFSPMYSLEQISLVNGRPVVQSQMLMALIQRTHGGDAVKIFETTNERAVIGFKRRGDREYNKLEWTIDDARRAGLDKKDVWKSYPRVMLRWRCIGEGARLYFADAIAGVYLPDELNVPVSVDPGGNVVIDQDAYAEEQEREIARRPVARTIEPSPTQPDFLPADEPASVGFGPEDLEDMGMAPEQRPLVVDPDQPRATVEQMAVIAKVSALVGEPWTGEAMTKQQAADRIRELNVKYSEQQRNKRPNGNGNGRH